MDPIEKLHRIVPLQTQLIQISIEESKRMEECDDHRMYFTLLEMAYELYPSTINARTTARLLMQRFVEHLLKQYTNEQLSEEIIEQQFKKYKLDDFFDGQACSDIIAWMIIDSIPDSFTSKRTDMKGVSINMIEFKRNSIIYQTFVKIWFYSIHNKEDPIKSSSLHPYFISKISKIFPDILSLYIQDVFRQALSLLNTLTSVASAECLYKEFLKVRWCIYDYTEDQQKRFFLSEPIAIDVMNKLSQQNDQHQSYPIRRFLNRFSKIMFR